MSDVSACGVSRHNQGLMDGMNWLPTGELSARRRTTAANDETENRAASKNCRAHVESVKQRVHPLAPNCAAVVRSKFARWG